MKQTKVLRFLKKTASFCLVAAVCVTSLPGGGLLTSEAAGMPAERDDPSIVYFVDCGDYTPDTVCGGDQFGTHNSVTDQVYATDAKTGYQWGIVDAEEEYSAQPGAPEPNRKNGTPPSNGGVYTANTWAQEGLNAANLASKTSTNRYTKNFYEKGITERFLQYKFELEDGKYEVTVCCTDPWSCSKSPNAYLNYGKENQVTIKEGMEASAQKPAKIVADVTGGELTVDVRAAGNDNKAINLAYILIKTYKEPTEEEAKKVVRRDYAALTLTDTELKSDLTLPTEGENGTKITWKSSNEAVLSSTGKVTRPAAGRADAAVTLTATVAFGEIFSMTKEFSVKVLAESDLKDLQEFSYDDVMVTDEYYNTVTEKDVEFLNKFDPDRLLYNFRLTAGYTANEIKEKDVHGDGTGASGPYPGGWENSRIGGHTLGHYLAGAAQAVANGYGQETGEDGLTLSRRLDYLIKELKNCQDKLKTGFIFGATMASVSDPERQFDLLEQGTDKDTWVPWYTMHKIVNGLVETYKLTGNETALIVAENLGEWIYNRTSKWNTTIQNRVLAIEYGGMNDCLYELYKYAKDDYPNAGHFAVAAHWFDETALFDNILNGVPNYLDGRHANCTIPKFMGALNRYRAMKDEGDESRYLQYAEAFWTLITEKHTYITGGNSECEFFGADNVLDKERSHCNCETCNTHNMLKLTRELYRITGDKKYADYYENTFINAIMASVDAETGMTTYFQPMATGYFKVYCNPDLEKNYFWCCTGTGLENFTKLGDSFYYYTGDKLIVNQYTSSNVTWREKGVTLKQETNIPDTDKATFTVQLNETSSTAFDLRLRVPDWTMGAPIVKVNGAVQNAAISNGYISLNRTWKNNDKVELTLPMGIRAYTLPDNAGVTYGFKYGPIVLAAELGLDDKRQTRHIGVQCDVCITKIVNGQERSTYANYGGTSNQGTLSTENLNVQAEDTVADYIANIEEYLVKDPNSLTFTLKGTDWDGEEELRFTPYYKITDQRYGIYWLFQESDPEVIKQQVIQSKGAGRDSNVTLDGVGIGYGSQTEGNAENYPHLEEEGNGSVGDMGKLTRYAKAGGSFSYLFKVDKTKKNFLICQYSKEDNGKTMVITSGDAQIAEDTLDNNGTEEIYSVKYEIPSEIVATARPYELRNETTGAVEMRDVIRISFSGKDGKESPKLWKNASTCTEYSHNAGIKNLTSNVGTVSKTGSNYQLMVPKGTKQVQIKTTIQDEFGLLYMDGELIDDTKPKRIALGGDKDTIVNLQVFAEDHETKADYKLTIKFQTLSGITVTPTKKSLFVGESTRLNYTVAASDDSQKGVIWKSSDPSVAKVEQNGVVTAKKQGTAVITVTSKVNSSLKATCTITVLKPSLAITGAADLAKGKSLKLKAKLTNIKGKVTWSVNSTKYATIKGNGATATLKAKKKVGKVKVTAQAAGIKKSVTIQVVNPVKSIKLNAKSKTLKAKKSFKLKATITPKNATNKKVTYKSSNKKVAVVSSFGKITAKKKGKVTITVISKSNPKVKVKCKVTVK